MSDLERFNELVDDIWEIVFGTVRRPEVKFEGMMTAVKPKRARTSKGRYKGDDKMTDNINEAWVGGKAPKKKKKNVKKYGLKIIAILQIFRIRIINIIV